MQLGQPPAIVLLMLRPQHPLDAGEGQV